MLSVPDNCANCPESSVCRYARDDFNGDCDTDKTEQTEKETDYTQAFYDYMEAEEKRYRKSMLRAVIVVTACLAAQMLAIVLLKKRR